MGFNKDKKFSKQEQEEVSKLVAEGLLNLNDLQRVGL